MAQAVSRRPVAPPSVHVEFVVDKVALGKAFPRVLQFPLSVSFHRGSPYSYIWVTNNRPVSGQSTETQFRPIDMNNNNLSGSCY
jgi:hypothetical protein